ncbi:nicotinic acid mononucleotide adenylyltransferase [Pseudoclavibacter sp. AY1F1]|uniref:nicotinate-nucleotide adenylyltransferase n=1 Tax=Pseudoclavibacter sp. AY1F1 TaxID=2080583 RepID=UPI000CE9056E|nr:nicotinate-nucleotide adenylyltransferase [Pseudoclavibacter sp. AY1F1]PPF44179.1 nicotinic acid mononucleotide adenylyltransferase [Pseudoclavibacter sp. AY1F1]
MPDTVETSPVPARRRVGVMGGTFDPIHHGHLVAASEAAAHFELDEVLFVPTGKPSHKSHVTPVEHRYLMTVIATASNPRFKVSRVDVDRDGPTYTIDTLRDVQRLRPDAALYFITGADAIAQILGWKNSLELFELAQFVAVSRPGHEMRTDGIPADKVATLQIPALAISSTDIRERAYEEKPVWYLVPDGVVQYMAKHRLYTAEEIDAI